MTDRSTPPKTLDVTIDGRRSAARAGATILDAIRAAGGDVPTLCHDERLRPVGACRICLVHLAGADAPVASCCTPARDGMVVTTTGFDDERRAVLAMMAERYPRDAVAAQPDVPFHRLLRAYGVEATGAPDPRLRDSAHPYIDVDMSRCITCLRCVRICEEVEGADVWRVLGRGETLRVAVGSGPTLKESTCTSCGGCASTCPTGAIQDHSLVRLGAPTATTRTICSYCGVGCELDVGTQGDTTGDTEGSTKPDRITQILPANDSPVNRGHLCVKGRYAFGFLRAPDRLLHPLVRERIDAPLREVTWDEAVAHTARRLRGILDAHGPDSIGVLGSARATNEENYAAQKFARAVLGTNNVDCCARVCHAPTAAAMGAVFGTGAATNSFDDIERARAILVCGSNATENHPVVGARIRQAARAGARLIVVDPRRTELAAEADIHLQLLPGTNVLLVNAMAHVLLRESLIDARFVADRVVDLDALRAHVARYAPEDVATRCGVEARDIARAARAYAEAKPALLIHGLGVTEHLQGTEGVECLTNLALLTGNIGVAGAGMNPLRGQNNVQGSAHMGCEPTRLTGFAKLDAPASRALFERAWGCALPASRGANLMEMLARAQRRELRALWAMGYDVLQTNPHAASTRAALASLELVVVQDLFLSETARAAAHVVFPAAAAFEKDGTFMNAERRVSRVRKCVEAPSAECRPDWRALADVAAALGRGDALAFTSSAAIWDEVRSVWPAGAGITWDRLEHGGLQWPCPTLDHPGTPILHVDAFASGHATRLSVVEHVPTAEVVTPELPFLLVTGRKRAHFNTGSMTSRAGTTMLAPLDVLDVHPADLEELGSHDGALVRVRSRSGEVVLRARAAPELRRGELFTTFHDPARLVNEVTSDVQDRVTGTPEYKVTAVALSRVS